MKGDAGSRRAPLPAESVRGPGAVGPYAAEDGGSKALQRGDSWSGPLALELRVAALNICPLPPLSFSPQGFRNYPASASLSAASRPPRLSLPLSACRPPSAHWSVLFCSAWSVADGTLSKHLNMSFFFCVSTLHLLTALFPEHFIAKEKGKKKKGTLAFIEINCESLQG